MLDFIKYSGIWIGFVLNPFYWQPDIKYLTFTKHYGIIYFEVNLGLVWFRFVLDDGGYT